jgi:hypothetical protein
VVSSGSASLVPADVLVEIVVGDDRWLPVDVTDVPADDGHVSPGIEVEPRGDVVRRRDPLDLKILPRRVVTLALDVGFPSVRRGQDAVVRALPSLGFRYSLGLGSAGESDVTPTAFVGPGVRETPFGARKIRFPMDRA